ncbi:hypothetical protein EAG11_00480 [Flavobacterium sp. 140616W15]|nr:hypothetical protein EAG11_00480 [Flavobacterium sp. 140616W15]
MTDGFQINTNVSASRSVSQSFREIWSFFVFYLSDSLCGHRLQICAIVVYISEPSGAKSVVVAVVHSFFYSRYNPFAISSSDNWIYSIFNNPILTAGSNSIINLFS